MAKDKTIRDLANLPDPESDTPIPEEDRLEGIDLVKINTIIESADVSAGGFIRVERKGPFDDKFAYLCRIEPKNFDIDTIKKIYGGGDYQCKTFRANGQMYKPFSFSIDARWKGQLDESQIKQLSDEKGNGGMNKELLQAVLNPRNVAPDSSNQMLKLMEITSSRGDQNMLMMMNSMQTLVTVMMASQEKTTQLMIAMMTAQKQSSGLDPVVVELLKQKAVGNPMEDTLKLLAHAKELVSDAKPEREPATWEKIVEAVGPSVAGAFFGGRVAAPAPNLPPTQVTDVKSNMPVELPKPPDDMMVVRLFLNNLLNAAARGSDPMLYIDMILDNLDENAVANVKQRLTEPGWPVTVFGDDPRVATVRPWLEKFKTLLLQEINLNGTTDPTEPNAEGAGQPKSDT